MRTLFTIDAAGSFKELIPSPCERENILESLIADYPRVLGTDTGSFDDDLRWMLIDRQFRIPGTRFPTDLLFVDQNATPTIVEVKLASNPEIRRDVVGQIVQYGASIAKHLNVKAMQDAFHRRCERGGKSPQTELDNLLLEAKDVNDFWKEVAANLESGRIRMVVVADEVPIELQTSLEFLNKQMAPADVFAIAIGQYTDKGQSMRILAPQVIGRKSVMLPLTGSTSADEAAIERPSEWTEAVQFNPDKSIQEFFVREAKTQRSSVTVRKIYYDADGIMRWRLQLNKSSVNMYQQMRFEDDLKFWKTLFPGISIRTPDQGRQLSFNLTSVKDLDTFVEAVRSADGKFKFLPRAIQGDVQS